MAGTAELQHSVATTGTTEHSSCAPASLTLYNLCETHRVQVLFMPSSFFVSLLFEGIIWFLLPTALVIVNDIMAYLAGGWAVAVGGVGCSAVQCSVVRCG